MLDTLIDAAAGPLLRLSLLVMALGLLRVIALQATELVAAGHRAGDAVVAWRLVLRRTFAWIVPTRALARRDRLAYNLASLVFHAGVIAVPVFLWGHIVLWERATGVSLWALPPVVSDLLSLVTVVMLAWLVMTRALTAHLRHLSRAQDWLLPLMIGAVFVTGLVTAHPTWSPVDARVAYLAHLLCGELLLVLVPFSKLQHIVLFWTSQTSSELGWRFVPGTGERVRMTLGRTGEGV